MKIWFVTIGEPVPLDVSFKDRLHRAGMMATAFSSAGHEVVWWTSGFDHFQKRRIVQSNKEVAPGPNFRIRIIKAPGYRRNVSLARLHDHYQVRRRFTKWAQMDSERPQLIVSSLPTIGLCKASITLGRSWGIPVIVDIRDLWPDIFTEVVPKALRSTLRLMMAPLLRDCRDVCKEAAALMGTTEEFLDWGLNRGGRKKNEFDRVLPFLYPETEFQAEELAGAERFWIELGILGHKQKVVTFTGSLGRQFRLDAVIRCAHRMTARDPNLRFALCGAGETLDYYRELAAGNPAIVLPGWIDAVKIRVLLMKTSIGFDPMPNRYDFLANINNKAVEYLASGVPILSTPQKGTLAELIRNTGIGESTTEGDDSALEISLNRMLGDPVALETMKANTKRVYNDRFNPALVYRTLIEHMEGVVKMHTT
jgi:glycosyltransferase involved in cell wall biosynthesis